MFQDNYSPGYFSHNPGRFPDDKITSSVRYHKLNLNKGRKRIDRNIKGHTKQ